MQSLSKGGKMFKTWRSEKNKIKAVFKLQFQATQIPQSKKVKFALSIVPEDVGRPTVRLDKVAVQQDGTCIWEKPIYETLKLTRESKTGSINEKIYYFVLSSGSSKSGFVGEVGINMADFTEAIVPTVLSLPLTTSDSGAILHVTIQKMDGDMDSKDPFREDVGSLKPASQDGRLVNQMISNTVVNGSGHSVEDEIAYADRPEYLSYSRNNFVPPKKADNSVLQRSNTAWSAGSDGSMAESLNSTEYNITGNGLEETLNSLAEKQKTDLVDSARRVELLELELQTLRKQVVKESKKGQELSMNNLRLKEERDAFEKECREIKVLQKNSMDSTDSPDMLPQEIVESSTLSEEMRKELNFEKRLNQKLRSQLNSTQDSNSELVLVVKDLKRRLDLRKREKHLPSGDCEADGLAEGLKECICKCKLGKDEDIDELQDQVKINEGAKEVDMWKQRILELSSDINMYRMEIEELQNHMEQLVQENKNLKNENRDLSYKSMENQRVNKNMQGATSDYLATIKELECQMEILNNENKKREHEFEKSFNTIEELVNQVRELELELEKQQERFEEDVGALIQAKTEQEQRAVHAEEALQKTKQSHSITAEKLQEEFRALSVEMASKFDENEKLTVKAQTEAYELRREKANLEDSLQKANQAIDLLKNQEQAKVLEMSHIVNEKQKEMETLLKEIENKSVELEYAKQRSEENDEASSMQIKMLRDDIERLTRENKDTSKRAEQAEVLRTEVELLLKKVEEKGMLVQKMKEERSILDTQYSLTRREAEKYQEDFNSMSCLKDGVDAMAGSVLLEMEKLKAECKELKCCLNKEELEKEDLGKQITQLKSNLQKDEAIFSIDKKPKPGQDGASQITSRYSNSVHLQDTHELGSLKKRLKTLEEQLKLKDAALGSSNNSFQEKETILKRKIKELENRVKRSNGDKVEFKQVDKTSDGTTVEERNKGLQSENEFETSPRDGDNHSEKLRMFHASNKLLTEMTMLKERNKSMEAELKEMEERYSEISLKFAEVEGERQQLVMTVRNLKNGKQK